MHHVSVTDSVVIVSTILVVAVSVSIAFVGEPWIVTRYGAAWHGTARHGTVWHGTAVVNTRPYTNRRQKRCDTGDIDTLYLPAPPPGRRRETRNAVRISVLACIQVAAKGELV